MCLVQGFGSLICLKTMACPPEEGDANDGNHPSHGVDETFVLADKDGEFASVTYKLLMGLKVGFLYALLIANLQWVCYMVPQMRHLRLISILASCVCLISGAALTRGLKMAQLSGSS